LVIIVAGGIVLFLEGLHKICPSGFGPKNIILVYGIFLTISVPPISDVGHNLKECKDDLLRIEKVVDKKIMVIDLSLRRDVETMLICAKLIKGRRAFLT